MDHGPTKLPLQVYRLLCIGMVIFKPYGTLLQPIEAGGELCLNQ